MVKQYVFDVLNRSYEVVKQQVVYAKDWDEARDKARQMNKEAFDLRAVY